MNSNVTGAGSQLKRHLYNMVYFQLHTPFNNLLVNLAMIELSLALGGNSVVAINSFYQQWTFSETACQLNAFGMAFLGKN